MVRVPDTGETRCSFSKSREREITERFLNRVDEDSFSALFRVFSPQLIAFFRRRGHEGGTAEDLAQEVMLTVYRRANQVRDRSLFRGWLFKVARHAAYRHYSHGRRQVPTVDIADVGEAASSHAYSGGGPAFEFRNWMDVLEPHERETMTLRFVEDWEYHEIAAAQAVPIGTVQWRVFNSKKKLRFHLGREACADRKAA